MDRRKLTLGIALALAAALMLAGGAGARVLHHSTRHQSHSTKKTETPETSGCIVKSLPSFMDQGEKGMASSVADLVEVECESVLANTPVTFAAQELFARCHKELSWAEAPEEPHVTGPEFTEHLDDAGNATAILWGGPQCAAGESLITADVDEKLTFTTSFTVEPPVPTAKNLSESSITVATLGGPNAQMESDTTSSVAAIIEVEFPPEFGEEFVNINDRQLYSKCKFGRKLIWVGPDEVLFDEETPETTVQLDDDGNAFVVLEGGESCQAGRTLVEASLDEAPYTTLFTDFTVLPPEPTI